MSNVLLRNVVKTYGNVVAVDNVSFEVEDGEFLALVGPSGCGKTTTLNLVAGLIELTDGEIYLGEKQINELDPKDRDLAMVFQNYALYPNKSVRENLAFPLKMRKLNKTDIAAQVERTAKLLSIDHLLDRRPRELSGGQQQRVALGRALVRNPRAFLMDEPLSNLDAKLRVQMRAELKRFHQELNATILYVTHDQLEAVTMADKIAVMNLGVLQQYASPDDVFNHPVNTFVAGFIGSPAMNLIPVTIRGVGDRAEAVGESGWALTLNPLRSRQALRSSTGRAVMGIRHSQMRLHRQQVPNTLPATIYTVEPTGDLAYVHFRLGEQLLVASAHADFRADPDDPIWVELDQDHLHLFDAETQAALAERSETVVASGLAREVVHQA